MLRQTSLRKMLGRNGLLETEEYGEIGMTKDEIMQIAREAGIVVVGEAVEKLCELVAAAEREECANICVHIASIAEHNQFVCDEEQEEFYSSRHLAADDCAEAIRTRGKE